MAYSNRISLNATYGENEVDGLLAPESDGMKLEKAAAEAQGEIDTYLHSAGYVLPLVFAEMDESNVSTLPGALQRHSDALTAYNLASATDLQKQQYETDQAAALAYLKSLLTAELRLVYPDGTAVARVDPPDGNGMVVVKARPQVFDRSTKPERLLFRPWDITTP